MKQHRQQKENKDEDTTDALQAIREEKISTLIIVTQPFYLVHRVDL